MASDIRQVSIPRTFEGAAWKWMRYSGILLIPLVWFHVILQDVVVGVHAMDAGYVSARWGLLTWQVYDILLLAFAFAHGVNGLRQVLADFVTSETLMRRVSLALLLFWAALTFIGGFAIVMATRSAIFSPAG